MGRVRTISPHYNVIAYLLSTVRMFGVDDPLNQATAEYFGIVMGTSHQEPMMRSTPSKTLSSSIVPLDSDIGLR